MSNKNDDFLDKIDETSKDLEKILDNLANEIITYRNEIEIEIKKYKDEYAHYKILQDKEIKRHKGMIDKMEKFDQEWTANRDEDNKKRQILAKEIERGEQEFLELIKSKNKILDHLEKIAVTNPEKMGQLLTELIIQGKLL